MPPIAEDSTIITEIVEELPTDVIKYVLAPYLTIEEIVNFDNTDMFKYSTWPKEDVTIAQKAAQQSANKILRFMFPHLSFTNKRTLITTLISHNNIEILQLFDSSYFLVTNIKDCITFNRLEILIWIYDLVKNNLQDKQHHLFNLISYCCEVNVPQIFTYLLSLFKEICKPRDYLYNLKQFYSLLQYNDSIEMTWIILKAVENPRSLNINKILKHYMWSEEDITEILTYFHTTKKGYSNHRTFNFLNQYRPSLEIFEYIHLNFMTPMDTTTFGNFLISELTTEERGWKDAFYEIIDYILDHRLYIGHFENYKKRCSSRVWSLITNLRNKNTSSENVNMLCQLVNNKEMVKHFKRFNCVNSVIHWAIMNGVYDVIELAHDEYMTISLSNIVYLCCIHNQLDLLKFFHTMRIDLEKDDILHGLNESRKRGYTHIVDYLEQFV